ncbi:MAG: tRNA (adenosine(37)-N6)-dimethylallyltransferase MiaA [Hyphomicrobiales bacterium]|nr:MAG: tRNA (adenosine(37)-N6)-dimethylallyltransferase MiaA [Hyphomicrobiales bacterium]
MAGTGPGKVVLIAGPTASGKSGMALEIARRRGGMIINADSMQVYRELRIITARPTLEEEREVPHALYGFVPAAEAYSVGRYVLDAARAIAAARKQGLLPIVVGGTGLYFKALLEGLSPIPAIDPGVRERWRRRGDEEGPQALHALLRDVDPEAAQRLMPTDKQRLVRALEVAESTGRTLSAWQKEPGQPVLDEAETVRLLVVADREALMQHIDARFDGMLSAGVLEEVRDFARLGLSEELPSVRAHGVRPLLAHLRGDLSLEEAAEGSKAETRQYAKRQVTWHRRNMMSWRHISTQQMESYSADIFAFID